MIDEKKEKAELRHNFRIWNEREWCWTCCFQSPDVVRLRLALIPVSSLYQSKRRNNHTTSCTTVPARLLNEILQLAPEKRPEVVELPESDMQKFGNTDNGEAKEDDNECSTSSRAKDFFWVNRLHTIEIQSRDPNSHNRATALFLLELMQDLPNLDHVALKEFNLCGLQVGQQLCQLLTPSSLSSSKATLSQLELDWCLVDTHMLQKLCLGVRRISNLRRLRITSCLLDDNLLNNLGERGILMSPSSLSLTHLSLAGNNVTSISLPMLSSLLQRLSNLRELSLASNLCLFRSAQLPTGIPDPTHIAEFLSQVQMHNCLNSLDLRATGLNGTVWVALFRVLEANRTLKHLDLRCNYPQGRLNANNKNTNNNNNDWLLSLPKLKVLQTLLLPSNVTEEWELLEDALNQNLSFTCVSVDNNTRINSPPTMMISRAMQERNISMNRVKEVLDETQIWKGGRGIWSLLLRTLAVEQQTFCSPTPLFYALRTHLSELLEA